MLRSWEHYSEVLVSMKCGECIEHMRICWPVKEEWLVVAFVVGGVTGEFGKDERGIIVA